jgi:hypothetical protein
VLALAIALRSGADSALLYESIAEAEIEDSYKHTENKMNMISAASEASGAILGGFLAAVSLVLPFWFRVGVECISMCVSFQLTPMKKSHKERTHSVVDDVRRILRFTATHKQLRATILLCGITGATTLSAVWLIQPYLGEADVDIYWYGVVWGALNASLVLFAWLAERVENAIGEYRTLLTLCFLPVLSFIALAVAPMSFLIVPVFLSFYFVRSLNSSFGRAYIQEHALADARASILSVQSLLFRLIFAIVGPVIGYIATGYSLSAALLMSGAFFFALSLSALLLFIKSREI